MKYAKPKFLDLSFLLYGIRATQKCGCMYLEALPPFLYVMSLNAYEADE